MRRAPLPEVQWLQQALRSTVERSAVSPAEIERELGLRADSLAKLLAGKGDLKVAHLFGILHVLGLDFWTFLVLALRHSPDRRE